MRPPLACARRLDLKRIDDAAASGPILNAVVKLVVREHDDGVFLGAAVVVGTRDEKNEDTGGGLKKKQRVTIATEKDRR